MSDIDKKDTEAQSSVTRRQFVTGVGGLGAGAVLGGAVFKSFIIPEEAVAIPASQGYLVADPKKCAGCTSCMMACALAHHGVTDHSLSRIQIERSIFAAYPNDVSINQCRQCPFPSCVDACPTGAMHVDTENGNVRTVDEAKCIGCERCVNACPFTPSRVQWNPIEKHAQKCDLCANTPFMSEDGGPGGKQACVAICPWNALSFVSATPLQSDRGYAVNLRNNLWSWDKSL